MPELCVYLLAGGSGTRAGSPKAWLPHNGKPLIQRQLDFLVGLFRPDSVYVSIQKDWLERCRKLNPDVHWVPEAEDSALGALTALLKESPRDKWGFVYHVDMPVWERPLFERLVSELPSAQSEGLDAIAPTFGGKKGHPVVLSPAAQGAVLKLDPGTDRLDHWLRTRKESTVEVPFACIHDNWNDKRQIG